MKKKKMPPNSGFSSQIRDLVTQTTDIGGLKIQLEDVEESIGRRREQVRVSVRVSGSGRATGNEDPILFYTFDSRRKLGESFDEFLMFVLSHASEAAMPPRFDMAVSQSTRAR